MEVLLFLIFVWGFITVVGHASWVAIAAIVRLFAIADNDGSRPPSESSESRDLAAAQRVVSRLVAKGVLGAEAASEMRGQLRELERAGQPAPITAPVVIQKPVANVDLAIQGSTEPTSTYDQEEEVFEAILVAADEADASGKTSPTDDSFKNNAPAKPSLSTSEVIGSFLAARNIRWGELVAGMMIVVCSIGLVISLWNTLVQTHRAIPSLIFLTANAAIYASGFYTLGRWKLRHTSRAVLVIATLLVPLSVLAGMAAAGTGTNAVQLSDPLTLITIAIAAAVYLTLVYRGSIALVRRHLAPSMTLAVVGPAAILPLMPAIVRTWEHHAGWIAVVGSIAVAIAVVIATRIGLHKTTVGAARVRSQFLVIAVGWFSLAMAVGYSVFAMAASERLVIAIATIPALVATAGATRHLITKTRSAVGSMSAAVVGAVCLGGSVAILPPAMSGETWLWAWALTWTVSGLAVGRLLKQPLLTVVASVPIGIATMLTSPGWISGLAWHDAPLLRRVIGGEPMLVALMLGLAWSAVAWTRRTESNASWAKFSAGGWIAIAAVVAMVLSVTDVSSMGAVPAWTVTAVLMIGAVAGAWVSRSETDGLRRISVLLGACATVLGWMSVFHPWSIGEPFQIAGIPDWIRVGVAAATTWTLFCEALKTSPSLRHWNDLAVGGWMIVAVVACFTAGLHGSVSTFALAACAAGWLWAASINPSVVVLRLSQIATLALATVVGYLHAWPWMFTSLAWQNGSALWAWAAALALVSLLWWIVRTIARIDHTGVNSRLGFINDSDARFLGMPDGQSWIGAIGLMVVAAVWPMASLVFGIFSDPGFGQLPVLLPIATLAGLACFTQLHESHRRWTLYVVGPAISWFIGRGVCALPMDAPERLVLATSVVAGITLLVGFLRPSRTWVGLAAPTLIAISSAALLAKHWWSPVVMGDTVSWFPAVAVASWWTIGALAMLFIARQKQRPELPAVSTALFTAAIVVAASVWTVSPIHWLQIAGIGLIGWGAGMRMTTLRSAKPENNVGFLTATHGCIAIAGLVGFGSSVAVTGAIFTRSSFLIPWATVAGLGLSVVTVLIFSLRNTRTFFGIQESRGNLVWPAGITLLAGQAAYAVYALGGLSGPPLITVIAGLWWLGSVATLSRSAWVSMSDTEQSPSMTRFADLMHIAVVALAILTLVVMQGSVSAVIPWFALGTLAVLGLQVTLIQATRNPSRWVRQSSQLFGWCVIFAGAFAWNLLVPSSSNDWTLATLSLAWASCWWIIWRVGSSRESEHQPASPDAGLIGGLTMAAIGETALVVLGSSRIPISGVAEMGFWIRLASFAAIPVVGFLLTTKRLSRGNLVAMAVAAATLLSVQAFQGIAPDVQTRWMVAAIASGFAVALVSHWIPSSRKLVNDTAQVAGLVALAGIVASVFMIAFDIADDRSTWATQLTVLSVAFAAWTYAILAETASENRFRHIAVQLAMATVALMASVGSASVQHPMLETAMRWLVASVVVIPMWMFAFPKLIGERLHASWSSAARGGAIVGVVAAVGSLLSMLVMETMLRLDGGIGDVSRTMVSGVAVTLALLSGFSGWVALQSGPTSKWQATWQLSDGVRRSLVIAAQVVGVACWLHLFLCKSPWAIVGLRAYWPLIVMALAFVSVGISEWARRRGDRVIAETLQQTSLYLPLIPVFGFWIGSVGSDPADWTFVGGKTGYEWLLAIGAFYYLALSTIWKNVLPRITAVVLANAALWVVLVQQPGWEFATHPQAWLIPPAVCVLIATHLYRKRIDAPALASIRYAATLVIYVSSTADMLIAQIGTSLAGPIVLVTLALAGMLAGVLLRVAPFLYLGAIFVFFGVASMVRHAQQSIDAVWPWWVFGITTGILLLVGLTLLEKNKAGLRSYAQTLSS
ncbi:hypothetical protein Poly51_52880 [Rubripirellula tenax]|uniref:Uncharacterized protein n=1 Tax=Rubripirellula tenax TaxID=2528015 RepID=A0A5C6EFB6_9BACT|nr:hypothetical protein [Rubripirellula tenax]TWU47488.1 hypothetical protein Poly51_52880 [Rubripirellula tenax]